jgi:hypothetical protein
VYADEVSDFPDSGRHTGEISVSDMLLPPYVPDLNEEILACLSKRERRYRVTDDGGFTLEDRLRDDSDDLWTTREVSFSANLIVVILNPLFLVLIVLLFDMLLTLASDCDGGLSI